ncbi:MAG TPA: UDP-N-acetylmuramoyl-L-alanine--D-glutamate ligase [Actinomycetota bacterium]|nr:UDP-N-acetylmuramoyl-L-alanine--D-glutamate ligase [Actinomycetota bacterium]
MSAFDGEIAVVIGAGVAGNAAARALVGEGARVRVTDARPREELGEAAALERLGIEVRAGGHDPADLEGVTLVVTSPGVPPDTELLRVARERGLPVWGEMELGARLARAPYLAVTGTNGKTTTTGMLASILGVAGLDVVACGNNGRPFPTAAREQHDVLVVEVSSFQLAEQVSFHPVVSVLLNLAPDHLDHHGSFPAYASAKARIFANQTGEDVHVGNRDDPDAAALSSRAPCVVRWFCLGEPDEGDVGYRDGRLVARTDDGEVDLGPVADDRAGHRANAAAAAAVALADGVAPAAIRRGLTLATPEPHRGEVVARIGGVRFVDDSKATNVHAALAAIDGVRAAVLIAGGRAKGQDLSPLGTRAARLAGVVAIGEAADDVERAFDGRLPVRRAGSIEEAVRVAYELAPADGVVLLAPACASWDQFADYAERGDRFGAAARAIVKEVRVDG